MKKASAERQRKIDGAERTEQKNGLRKTIYFPVDLIDLIGKRAEDQDRTWSRELQRIVRYALRKEQEDFPANT